MQLFVHLRFVVHRSADLSAQHLAVARSQPSDMAAKC